ncbi:MAG: tRNA pseudouridine(38-40) synthase TruA [Prevotella sp.]|uniref:tRNA pseudouridine(38-40) synthase TruA n=1 Tax=Prevotella sp. AGR2160 TaxID=1280674 RepID=UPI00040257A9|nr:tRNA pseudouridine(38-40) synthase TruA [Prevotella sp. AGR2160]MDD5861001.1 tRNA pseudouridine(38-40) synthase TruA [Prevotella sp.]
MQRYFIEFAYDGTHYHGWARQPQSNSVQEELEHALRLLLRREILVTGAGRTDAGVHARQMYCHFDWKDNTLDELQLAYRLNRILPRDISVRRVVAVDDSLHARFSAIKREYRYYLHQQKAPFLRHYSWEVHYPLDFALMNKGAALLIGKKDFACFCKAGADSKTTICDLTEAHWDRRLVDGGDEQWVFTIAANRFLRNMVRAVVGTLVDLGRHRISLEDFRRILAGGTRSDAGESVPGYALFLERVIYPEGALPME